MAADPYSILGVERGADEAAIKSAYRKLAKKFHPDANKDNPQAAEKFSAATNAYDLLSDKDKRAQFDRGEIDGDGNPAHPFAGMGGGQGGFRPGQGGGGGGFEFSEGGDLGDIFEGLFRGGGGQQRSGGGPFGGFGRRAPQKGADVAYRLAVDFEDAARLDKQRITLQSGKTIDLKLTAAAVNGKQMKLAGQGQEGPGGKGDALVTISVKPHKFYELDGDDIRLDVPIGLDEAVLGAKIKVPTVDGAVMLTVPKNAASGKTLRLKGKGFPKTGGGRGDQLVKLEIDLPENDKDLTEFIKSWKPGKPQNPRSEFGV